MASPYGSTEHASTPIAANGEHNVLLTQAGTPFSGAAGTTVLPASGAFTASAVNSCDKARRIAIEFNYKANASTATGAAEIIVLLCKQKIKYDTSGNVVTAANGAPGAPLYNDAGVWFIPAVANSTVATGALASGTIAGTPTFTGTQVFQKVTYGPLAIELAAATASSAIISLAIDIDCTSLFWWYL